MSKVEFDYETAKLDSEKYKHGVYMADPDGASSHPGKHWVDGRLFQFEKDRAEIERLKQDMNLVVSSAGKDLLAERDSLRAANKIMREALEKVAAEFGTDYCSGDTIIAYEALAQVDKIEGSSG